MLEPSRVRLHVITNVWDLLSKCLIWKFDILRLAFHWSQWYRLAQVGQSFVWTSCNAHFAAIPPASTPICCCNGTKYKSEIDNKYNLPQSVANKYQSEFGNKSKIDANNEVEDLIMGMISKSEWDRRNLIAVSTLWIGWLLASNPSNHFETKAEIETLWRPKGRN